MSSSIVASAFVYKDAAWEISADGTTLRMYVGGPRGVPALSLHLMDDPPALLRELRDVLTEHLWAIDPEGEAAEPEDAPGFREKLEGFMDKETVATIYGDGQSAELAPVDPVDIDTLVADGAEFVADDGAGPGVDPEANANIPSSRVDYHL